MYRFFVLTALLIQFLYAGENFDSAINIEIAPLKVGMRYLRTIPSNSPKELNEINTIAGWWMLSTADKVGKHFCQSFIGDASKVVTAKAELQFHMPAFDNDDIHFATTLLKTGETSLDCLIEIEAQRGNNTLITASGHFIFVHGELNLEEKKVEKRALPEHLKNLNTDFELKTF